MINTLQLNQKQIDKFWSRVDIKEENNCWNWMGYKDKFGYGKLTIQNKDMRANRVSYIIYNGYIPDDLIILHSCNNKACVNPNHLRAGTNKENTNDSMLAGTNRSLHQNGEENSSSKISEKQAIEIIDLYHNTNTLLKEISLKYGIAESAVYKIATGKNWAYLHDFPKENRSQILIKEGEEIRKLYNTGKYKCNDLAKMFNLSYEATRLIITNQKRKNK